jgi:hypothetical protein
MFLKRPVLLLVGLVAGVVAGAVVVWNLPQSTPQTVMRFRVPLVNGEQFGKTTRSLLAISPNGMQMVYAANHRLYVSSLSEFEPTAIPGTEDPTQNVTNPVFSPDGQSVAFWSGTGGAGLIKKVAITGGTPITICGARNPEGISWDADGILFGQSGGVIMRVSAMEGNRKLLSASTVVKSFAHRECYRTEKPYCSH